MPSVLKTNLSVLSDVITLKRDDCHVIYRSMTTPEVRKSAFDKLRRIVKKIPVNAVDTVGEVRQIRDSGGNL